MNNTKPFRGIIKNGIGIILGIICTDKKKITKIQLFYIT